MFDLESSTSDESLFDPKNVSAAHNSKGFLFHTGKRVFDVSFSIVLLPLFLATCCVILLLNPFFNRGPLFFVQLRMGRHCRPFRAIKFRSMTVAASVTRGAEDPIEQHRITPFGRFLRRTRIDEVPQILNVIKGQMSLIGPRPDYFSHARFYVRRIPGYRERHAVRPGISGLAQTELGYAEGLDATESKVRADLYYIMKSSPALEVWIFWRTLTTVFGRRGA